MAKVAAVAPAICFFLATRASSNLRSAIGNFLSTSLPTLFMALTPNPPPTIVGTIVGIFSRTLSRNQSPIAYVPPNKEELESHVFSKVSEILGFLAAAIIRSIRISSPRAARFLIPKA